MSDQRWTGPDLVECALLCEKGGCDGIALHLHENKHDIQDRDVFAIKEAIRGKLNLQIALSDEIIDTAKSTLNEFSIEMPDIPASLNHYFLSIMEASVNAGEELMPAARAYFKSPYTVREKLLKVYYFESETDKISKSATKFIFQEMKELDLAHKSHLRYIISHIEKISDNAQKAADLLSAMAIKIVM